MCFLVNVRATFTRSGQIPVYCDTPEEASEEARRLIVDEMEYQEVDWFDDMLTRLDIIDTEIGD